MASALAMRRMLWREAAERILVEEIAALEKQPQSDKTEAAGEKSSKDG